MSVYTDSSVSLDELIENEKRALVRECLQEAWDELSLEDIDPTTIAEVIIEAALKRLVKLRGDQEATKMLARFADLDDLGMLAETHSLH